MSDCLCDICKKNVAVIQLTGEGKFCLDCHNEKILKKYKMDNTFRYAPTITVMGPGGACHTFTVKHFILGDIVSWYAYENDGDYHFNEISPLGENGSVAAERFIKKIVDGVCTKTLEEGKFGTSLKEKGSIAISVADRSDEAAFVIDGHKFLPEEFANLLSVYEGFVIQYQIHDASDPVLKEDEYLMPVRITKDSLIDELNELVCIHCDDGFLSYDDTFAFEDSFYRIIDKLQVLYNSSKREEAASAGKEMIRILTQIETDDDFFPRSNIEALCKVIDPFGRDEELGKIVQEWEENF